MTDYKKAWSDYLAAAQDAVKFTDPNWTNTAITRERYKRLTAARKALAAVLPPRSEQGAANDAGQAEALAQLAVTNADSAAVANNEWAKLKSMLDSGRNLAQLISNADRRRLSAVLDHLDADLAPGSEDPEGVRAEIEGRVLSRLAELGDEKAQQVQQAAVVATHENAWRQVIEQGTRGEVNIPARTALRRASTDEYEAAFPDSNESDAMREAIAHLDRLAPSLAEAPSGDASA